MASKVRTETIYRVDNATGEIIHSQEVYSNTRMELKDELTREQRDYWKNMNEHRSMSAKLGGFSMVLYYDNELLFKKESGLSSATITRLIMLSTFMDFENRLVKVSPNSTRGKSNENDYFTCLKDFENALKISKRSIADFMKEARGAGILMERDGSFFLSKKYFFRGELPVKLSFTRVYINSVRDFYYSVKTTQHRTLSYLFQLMPRVHWETNYIVKDRDCKRSEMQLMTPYDICEFLGLSRDSSNVSKVTKDLINFTMVVEGITFPVFSYVKVGNALGVKTYFVINPLFYTSTNNYTHFHELLEVLCDTKK